MIDQTELAYREVERLRAENKRLRQCVVVLAVVGTFVWLVGFIT